MINSLKSLFSYLFICIPALIVAVPLTDYCGGGDWNYKYSYYAIVDQRELVDPQYYPLLYCPESALCSVPVDSKSANINAWKQYLGVNFSYEEIEQLVYKYDKEWYDSVKKGSVESTLSRKLTNSKLTYFIDYMILAKNAESSTSDSYTGNGWYQGETGKTVDKAGILNRAQIMIKDAPDDFMKHRLGFQIVRAAHYLNQNQLAISMFETYFKDSATDYMTYRAQEQAAGASFNLMNYNEAIAGFTSAFFNMPDRRYNNAINLKYTYDHALKLNDPNALDSSDSYYFFRSFIGKSSDVNTILDLAQNDVNSPYLTLMLARQIDQTQARIFAIDERLDIYGGREDNDDGLDSALVQLSLNPQFENKELVILLLSLRAIESQDYDAALQFLKEVSKNEIYAEDVERLSFIINTKQIDNIDPRAINHLYEKLESRPVLNQHPAVVAAFFNTVARLYKDNDDPISAALISVNYSPLSNNFDWNYQKAKRSRRDNYEFDLRYPFIEKKAITSFQHNLASKNNKTNFEKLVLERLDVNPLDFANDMMGTYLLAQGQTKEALSHFKKIKYPASFWEENVRPEIVSSSIKEWMNVDFASISDQMHIEYASLVGKTIKLANRENYRDNKIKLAQLIIELESKGNVSSNNQAAYNYMLGNIWYNISVEGWFLNDLYYVSNDQRNPLKGYGWDNKPIEAKYQQVIDRASYYFEKALKSTGNKELKAKATFALAKTNRCFSNDYDYNSRTSHFELCGDHIKYFDQLYSNYADTQYYQEILKECSWFIP